MLKWVAKVAVEKIIGAVIVLLAVGAAVLFWRYHNHLPTFRATVRFVGGSLLWLVLATLLPWATFFLVAWVRRAQSNLPAVLLLVFWASLDGLLAWWLSGAGTPAAIQWFAAGLAFCLGGLYNLIAANQIANRIKR